MDGSGDAHVDRSLAGPPESDQQVMSPRGVPAQGPGASTALPNGIPASERGVAASGNDMAFEQVLGAAMQGESTRDDLAPQADVSRDVRASRDVQAAQQDAVVREGSEDRPLLPHAAVGDSTLTTPVRATPTAGLWAPSPFPTPTGTREGNEVTSTAGMSFVQHGAAAMRWFGRLGEYVQRRATAHTRPTGEATTVVEETSWSPTRAWSTTTANQGENEPLFSGGQVRRLRELEVQAPQLYGAVATTTGGASSETSGSYSKEQLELEVRRQVEAAMTSQRQLVDENQRLRQELEKVKASVRSGGGDVRAVQHVATVYGGVRPPPGLGQGEVRVPGSGGNPTGLSEHNREQGGLAGLSSHVQVPSGNPVEPSGHDGRGPGDVACLHGGLEGNSAGPTGRNYGTSERASSEFFDHGGASMKQVLQREVEGLRGKNMRGLGGNPSGLPERGCEPRGKVWFSEGDDVQGEVRVPSSGNPAGLSEHNREGGRMYNMQYVPSASGLYESQYVPSASGPSMWNPLGTSSGTQNVVQNEGKSTEAVTAGDVAGSNNASPMEALLKGMSQLQQAMAIQVGLQTSRPESIRPGVSGSELPKLPDADEFAAINVGDWMHGLAGPMGDLTDGSSTWWSCVIQSLEEYYKVFLSSTAVKKVQLRAEDFAVPTLADPKWSRVDKRAATMLLQAVPENIKSELLANRLSTTLSILARILTIYRPGSSVERQQVLKALESPGNGGGSAMELVEVLRKWSRWLKRASDLGLQPPDASILLKGLDSATRQLLERNSEVAFRTNMMRFSLDLDSAPTQSAVIKFHGHLLAECEQLAYRGRGKGAGVTPTVKAANAAGEQMNAPTTPKGGGTPTATGAGRPCKFFAQESGCQRANCKFVHDWANIPKEEKPERCKGCGARGHMKKNCPMKSGGEASRKGEDGKGGAPPRVRSATTPQQKGSNGKREDGTVHSGEPQYPTTSSTTSAPTATTESASTGGSASGGERGDPADIDDFLKNATQILKMMAEKQGSGSPGGPSMKMLKKAVRRLEGRMALVDSGATHPLREAKPDEWVQSPEVDVVIAGDGVTTMRQNSAGTLLLEPLKAGSKPQTIVPVGNLIGLLGYELSWSRKRCVLRAPDGREEVLKMTSGCPEVNEALALELIAKIEQEKLQQLERTTEESRLALIRAMRVEKDPQWEKSLRRFVDTGKFEDGFAAISSMPWATDVMNEDLVRTVADIPHTESEAWELMKSLGFNRRMRKRMMHKDWVVRFYSGKRSAVDKMFKVFENNGTMMLDIDVMRWSQLDMLKPTNGITTLMLWGAATGRIAATFAAVPRNNTFEHSLRVVVINEVAKMGRKVMCEAVDVPEDGVAMCMWASSQAEEDESSTPLAA